MHTGLVEVEALLCGYCIGSTIHMAHMYIQNIQNSFVFLNDKAEGFLIWQTRQDLHMIRIVVDVMVCIQL